MTKEKNKQCSDCLKQIKLAKKYGQYNPKLREFFLKEFDITEAELREYEEKLN